MKLTGCPLIFGNFRSKQKYYPCKGRGGAAGVSSLTSVSEPAAAVRPRKSAIKIMNDNMDEFAFQGDILAKMHRFYVPAIVDQHQLSQKFISNFRSKQKYYPYLGCRGGGSVSTLTLVSSLATAVRPRKSEIYGRWRVLHFRPNRHPKP